MTNELEEIIKAETKKVESLAVKKICSSPYNRRFSYDSDKESYELTLFDYKFRIDKKLEPDGHGESETVYRVHIFFQSKEIHSFTADSDLYNVVKNKRIQSQRDKEIDQRNDGLKIRLKELESVRIAITNDDISDW